MSDTHDDAAVWAEIMREQRKQDRADWRAAFGVVWRFCDYSDLSLYGPLKRFAVRFGLTVALALGRGYRERSCRFGHGIDVAYWDYHRGYEGWSCKTIEFWPRTLRYSIGSDGDSFL